MTRGKNKTLQLIIVVVVDFLLLTIELFLQRGCIVCNAERCNSYGNSV